MLPLAQFQRVLYALLNNDVTLAPLIQGVFDFIPQGEAFNTLQIGVPEFRNTSGIGVRKVSGSIQLNTWVRGTTRGKIAAYEIMEEISRILRNAEDDFVLTNWKMIAFSESFSTVLVESDTVTYHGVMRFRFEAVENCPRQ